DFVSDSFEYLSNPFIIPQEEVAMGIIERLTSYFRYQTGDNAKAEKAVSKFLYSLGIKGNKYADWASRLPHERYSENPEVDVRYNFVHFHESNLTPVGMKEYGTWVKESLEAGPNRTLFQKTRQRTEDERTFAN